MASRKTLFELFDKAVEIASKDERAAFLDVACDGDSALRGQVESLLAEADHVSDDFLEQSAIDGAVPKVLIAQNKAFCELSPGSVVGPYKLLHCIGEGGMGSVYLAEQKQPVNRRIALKVVRPGFGDAQSLARFEAERQALASMDHPSFARVYEAGATLSGLPYLAMEFVSGEPITDYCDKHALPILDRLRIFTTICAAIQHAHQNGIIHRDIKPSNILVSEVDGKPAPKIIDFGIAKAFAGKLTERALMTQSGMIFGTLEYMSPEQAGGNSVHVDTRSDVYSLGVLLYELLAGAPPIDRKRLQENDLSEALRIIREEDPPPPSIRVAASKDRSASALLRSVAPAQFSRSLQGDLDWIVMQALEKDRARRYESPNSLARDIQNFLDFKPISARPPSRVYVFTKWVRRNRTLFAAACTVVAALTLGAIGIFAQWRCAEAARVQAESAQRYAESAQGCAEAARIRAESNEIAANSATIRAEASATAQRRAAYADTLAAALAARERYDLGQARRLLDGIAPELRGFEWRLLRTMCEGDDQKTYQFGEAVIPECLAWHPDGKTMAVITSDKHLQLFDASGNAKGPARALPTMTVRRNVAMFKFRGLTYSPNGRRLAYTDSNALCIVDAETLQPIHKEALERSQFAWLDDDRLLFGRDTSMYFFNGAGAWILHVVDHSRQALPEKYAAPLAVSADRSTIALSETHGKEVYVFRAEALLKGAPIQTCRLVFNRSAHFMTLSATGDYLALATGSVFARALSAEVIETATGKSLLFQDYRLPINSLAIDSKRTLVALVGDDAVVRFLNFSRSVPVSANSYDDGVVPAIRAPLDGNGAHDPPNELSTRSAQEGRAIFLFGHERRVNELCFSPDGNTLSTIGADGSLRRWNVEIPQPTARIDFVRTWYYGMHPAASADGKRVLSVRLFGEKTVFKEMNKPSVECPKGHYPLAILKDGRFVTLHGATGFIYLFEVADGQARELWHIPGPHLIDNFRYVRSGVLSHDERYVAGAAPGKLFVVDLDKRTVVDTDDLHQQMGNLCVCAHAVSPNGRWIAATSFGRRTRIYKLDDPRVELEQLGEERDYDTGVAFSPDSSRLYTGSEDGTVRVWNTATWKELSELRWTAHQAAVSALAISNDGTLIATSGDNTLKLWRAERSAGDPVHELLAFRVYHSANWIHFATDGQGHDRALLFSAPWRALEIWEARAP